MNSFYLGGWHYTQKFRQCGKVNCICRSGPENEHGPYWYRSKDSLLHYVGRDLPVSVVQAVQVREDNLKALSAEMGFRVQAVQAARDDLARAERNVKIFERAIMGGELSESDINLIRDCGINLGLV